MSILTATEARAMVTPGHAIFATDVADLLDNIQMSIRYATTKGRYEVEAMELYTRPVVEDVARQLRNVGYGVKIIHDYAFGQAKVSVRWDTNV